MSAPQLVRTRIRHVRTIPLRHEFAYRSYSWLVDVGDLPALPLVLAPFARFHARDHFGDPKAGIRANIEGYLAAEAIDLDGGQVLMLTNARVLGYVFNPLTVFWCHNSDGALVCVIAEVHNTYGGRHRYLLRPDYNGKCVVAKTFYVSPFNPVEGHYRLYVPEPVERLRLAITLFRPDGTAIFTATMTGAVLPAQRRILVRALLAVPLAPLLVSAQIRWQGIRLWVRGLPIAARPNAYKRETLP